MKDFLTHDGISNINIKKLLKFHKKHKKSVTLTAVRPQTVWINKIKVQ